MTCFYPHGPEEDWCERHRIDTAFVRALRRERAAADALKRRPDIARA